MDEYNAKLLYVKLIENLEPEQTIGYLRNARLNILSDMQFVVRYRLVRTVITALCIPFSQTPLQLD